MRVLGSGSRSFIWLSVVLSYACANSSGATERTSPVLAVTVHEGQLRGLAVGKTREFLGIPYAAPPLAELRFAPPSPANPWPGVRDARAFGARCPQPNAPLSDTPHAFPGSALPSDEDCLTLNVYTPRSPPKEGAAVIVFLHGGSFVSGGGADYDARALSERGDVVVVTLNYRLGALGFLAHDSLDRALGETSGNMGLRDTQQALTWLKDNIAAFGGDPTRVTLAGESAGAILSCVHMFATGSENLAQQYIMESGGCVLSAVAPLTRAGVAAYSQALIDDLCGETADTLACLRALDADALAGWTRAGAGALAETWGVYVDGQLLAKKPVDALALGQFQRRPFIVGSNLHEGALLSLPEFGGPWVNDVASLKLFLAATYPNDASALLSLYGEPTHDDEADPWLMQLVTDAWFRCPARALSHAAAVKGGTAYLYSFEAGPAAHAQELDYVFDTALISPFFASVAADPPTPSLVAATQRYWTNFAKSGDPNSAEDPHWPAHTAAHGARLVLDETLRVDTEDSDPICDTWGRILLGVSTHAVSCSGSPCESRLAPACCTGGGAGRAGDPLELAGRAPNLCGVDLSQFATELKGVCLQLAQPGELDSNCPDVPNSMPGQPALKGCCSDEGFCAGYEPQLPLGCSYGAARGRPCGADAGTTDAGDTDAGTTDAGDTDAGTTDAGG